MPRRLPHRSRSIRPNIDRLFVSLIFARLRLHAVVAGAIGVLIAGASLTRDVEFAAPQPMAHCGRAKSVAERAICADPRLAVADSEMAKAYAALRAILPAGQRPVLLDDQRQWIGMRDA